MMAEAEARAMRRRLAERRKARADSRSGLPFTLPLAAPPADLRLTNGSSRSTVEPRNGGYLGMSAKAVSTGSAA
jgi:hypothetical protein